jgi:hypothetical protein
MKAVLLQLRFDKSAFIGPRMSLSLISEITRSTTFQTEFASHRTNTPHFLSVGKNSQQKYSRRGRDAMGLIN